MMSMAELVIRLDSLSHKYERFVPRQIVFFFCRRVEALSWDDFWDALQVSGTQVASASKGPVSNPLGR